MISATVTLTGAVLRNVTWGSFGKPVRIEEADGALASAFVYGPDRARIKQTSYVGATATKTVIYAGGGFERHIAPGAPDELVHYIGGAVAVFTRTDDANPATDKTRYLHKDHLGSVVMVTDEAGLVAETRSHDAWGGLRNADWTVPAVTPFLTETARGFTGHEHLQAVGLIHMNGRVYDPKLGRMLSADPFVPDPTATQSFNRYSYVRNNPLSFTDPTGFHEGANDHPPEGGSTPEPCGCKNDDNGKNTQDGKVDGGGGGGGYDGNPRGDNPEGGGGEGGYGGLDNGTGSGGGGGGGGFGDGIGGGGLDGGGADPWAVAGVASVAVLADDGTVVGVADDFLIPIILAGALAYDVTQRTYVTYVLTNPVNGLKYVGRTSGFGTPQQIVARRYSIHAWRALGFVKPAVDRAVQGWWGYPAIRGREQQLIDSLGGTFNPVTNPITNAANPIRGVSKINPLGYFYHEASNLSFSPLYRYTGANPTTIAIAMIHRISLP